MMGSSSGSRGTMKYYLITIDLRGLLKFYQRNHEGLFLTAITDICIACVPPILFTRIIIDMLFTGTIDSFSIAALSAR